MGHPSSSVSRNGLRFNREFTATVIRRRDPRFPTCSLGFKPEFIEGDPLVSGDPSMRILTLDGADTSKLQVGEEWLVQVVGKPHYLIGRSTRDGRTIIRLNVRPVLRIETRELVLSMVGVDSFMFRLETCSGELLLKDEPVETTRERSKIYALDDGRFVVDVDVYSAVNPSNGETVYAYEGWRVLDRQAFFTSRIERLGRLSTKAFNDYAKNLPPAPDELVKLIPAHHKERIYASW